MDRANNIINNGIDFNKLNNRADFGKGFYLTDSYALAKNTAKLRYEQDVMKYGAEETAVPVVMRFFLRKSKLEGCNIKEFKSDEQEWKEFVCCNRWYEKLNEGYPDYDNNVDKKYDVVIGLTADGNIGRLDRWLRTNNYVLSEEFWKKVKPLKTFFPKIINGRKIIKHTVAYQISFHNQEIINSCIKYIDYDIISTKEDGNYEQK